MEKYYLVESSLTGPLLFIRIQLVDEKDKLVILKKIIFNDIDPRAAEFIQDGDFVLWKNSFESNWSPKLKYHESNKILEFEDDETAEAWLKIRYNL